jgi:biopolymer transport protein TolR
MGMGPASGKGVKSEINVTPLVDVVLVLLIIFMVVAPMLQRAKAVQLPKATYIDKSEVDEEPLMLSISADKKIWLGESLVTKDLEARIKTALKENPDKQIMIKGDARLLVKDVRQAMQRIRSAGAKGVGLGVEEVRHDR